MFTWVIDRLGSDTPVHLTAFHPQYKMQDRRSTPAQTVIAAREQAIARGLNYVYTGNIYNPGGEETKCHNCGTAVIERNRYQLDIWNLENGQCAACGEAVPGVFNDEPGSWGNRRQGIS